MAIVTSDVDKIPYLSPLRIRSTNEYLHNICYHIRLLYTTTAGPSRQCLIQSAVTVSVPSSFTSIRSVVWVGEWFVLAHHIQTLKHKHWMNAMLPIKG
jgi:hypothetical protein